MRGVSANPFRSLSPPFPPPPPPQKNEELTVVVGKANTKK